MEKIFTEYVYPPIPDRRSDWSAVFDSYEPGGFMGWGPTKEAAIKDLEEQYQHQEEERTML